MQKLEPRNRKVKVLATVGPASRSPEVLARLVRAGADAFRVNMSHGDHATHAETIKAIRDLLYHFPSRYEAAARSRSLPTCKGRSCA